jgi:AdoMet-dependent rRNA methyltransferase SPB1
MIRKKHREKIIDSTYNRYSYNDEDTSLPSWFLDDEKKHNILNLPITKEEV